MTWFILTAIGVPRERSDARSVERVQLMQIDYES